MTWLDKLERRFGFLGIPGLIRIVIGFTALVYVLVFLNRGFESFLTLDPALILRGQVWRLVTYIGGLLRLFVLGRLPDRMGRAKVLVLDRCNQLFVKAKGSVQPV